MSTKIAKKETSSKPLRGIGRPSKLTPETKEQLFAALQRGLSYKDSCIHAGIDFSTFCIWRNKGKIRKSGPFSDFLKELKRVQVDGKLALINKVRADKTWQSHAWLLERQYPDEFARRERIEQSGGIDVTIKKIVQEIKPDE